VHALGGVDGGVGRPLRRIMDVAEGQSGARHLRALRVLDHVRQFVHEDSAPGGAEPSLVRAEDDVVPDGVGERLDGAGRLRRHVTGVHTDFAEVVPEPLLHLLPRRRVKGLPG